VFGAGHHIYAYLQTYKQKAQEEPSAQAATTMAPTPLFAYVTLYQGGKKVYETQPAAVTPAAGNNFNKMSFNFDIDTGSLPRGQYDCQITVLDPATQKSAVWRAPVMLAE